MRTLLLVGAVLALGGLARALEDDIAGWIRDLGSEDPKAREAAAVAIEKAGERARPALEEAAKSADPEVASEAAHLLRKLDGEEKPQERRPPAVRRPMVRMSSTRVIVNRDGTTTLIQEDSTGRILVRETKDGKSEEYAAESREAFVEKYPEVAKRHGIDKGEGGLRVVPSKDLPEEEELKKELERLRREAEERLKERKALRDLDREKEELEKALEEQGKTPGDEPGLEVTDLDEALRYQLDIPEGGVLVTSVDRGSRAARLGVRRFDILLSLNGKPVATAADIRAAFAAEGPATAQVIREGEPQALREQE
ncbi:MAG: hypothetical protein IT452_23300 [Planctomycetia bacterium]|nr:hypothetical protein [Planctomycetia bacterium]